MNDLASVGLTFFGISIALLVVFIPDYYIKLRKLKTRVGNLKSSVNNSMISIAKEYDGQNLLTVIEIIQEEEVKLLMPPVENMVLARAAFFFMATSLTSAIIGLSAKFIPTYLSESSYVAPLLYLVGILMIISFFLVWWLVKLEIHYYEVIAKRRRDGNAELVVCLK